MSEENKTVELKEEELEKVSGGKAIIFYGLNQMASTCPHCNTRNRFRFQGGAGYTKGAQMGTCTCGAIIKANSDGTVLFEKNGVSLESPIEDDTNGV